VIEEAAPMRVDVDGAQAAFERLVQLAADGEEVVITSGGTAVAKLVPYREERGPRTPGGWKGRVWIGPDFDDDLPPDMAAAFSGERE
jgi:prevent-host-death family protein